MNSRHQQRAHRHMASLLTLKEMLGKLPLTGHRVGKVHAKTGEITEYPTPTNDSGTRRIAIDSTDKLWFTEYNTAKIGSLESEDERVQRIQDSYSNSGPYAIWVDFLDNVWFSMTRCFQGRQIQSKS